MTATGRKRTWHTDMQAQLVFVFGERLRALEFVNFVEGERVADEAYSRCVFDTTKPALAQYAFDAYPQHDDGLDRCATGARLRPIGD